MILVQTRLPLLITGITGVAGFNAFHYFCRRYPGQVIGVRPRQKMSPLAASRSLESASAVALDAEDAAGMQHLFERHRFRSVLNCVGNCALKSCELDSAMARILNVDSARHIADNARRQGSRLVHLSSDLVFS